MKRALFILTTLFGLFNLDAGELSISKRPDDCGFFYLGIAGGASCENLMDTTARTSTAYFGAASAGYQFQSGLRTELELQCSGTDLKLKKRFSQFFEEKPKGDLTRISLSANLLYEISPLLNNFPVLCDLYPYFGVGVGYAHRKETWKMWDFKMKENENKCMLQGIAGVAYYIDYFRIAIEYRRIDVCNDSIENAFILNVARLF